MPRPPVFRAFSPCKPPRRAVFALFFCLLLSACRQEARTDAAGLRRLLQKNAPQYAFHMEDLYYRDGVYYLYYSLHSENDLLLTALEDESGKLTRVTLAAIRGTPAAEEDLPALGAALALGLMPGCDEAALYQQTGIRDPGAPGSPPAKTYLCGRYRATLYAGENALCFLIERPDAAEAETTGSPRSEDGVSSSDDRNSPS